MFPKAIAALVALLFSLWGSNGWATRGENITLVVGQQKLISAPGVTRIAIANPNVADVRVVGSGEVFVTAAGSGQTELTIWRGSRVIQYRVAVTSMDPRQLVREVEKLLGDREGIRVRALRDSVYLEGNALTLPDLEKAEEISRLYPQVKNMVKLDPTAHTHIAQAINKQLTRAGLANAHATVVGSTIFLEGMVDTEADKKKAEIITRGIGQNIESVLVIGSSRMVELDVEFVEVSKNSLDKIGLKWPTNISGTASLDFTETRVLRGDSKDIREWTGKVAAQTSFGLALQFNDGISRLLARPRLVTASNREAKFLAGGEVPIPIATKDRMHVEWKEYGIRLNITPVADALGFINTKITTEVSQIDQSVAVMGIPGFLSRRVTTEVSVRDGETIVLSGLLYVSEGKDVTKVPLLGHIPIIGELFKSRNFREQKTELVIFVTPRIVDPLSTHLKKLSTYMLKQYEDAEADVGFDVFD